MRRSLVALLVAVLMLGTVDRARGGTSVAGRFRRRVSAL